jgi:hypothetical protein
MDRDVILVPVDSTTDVQNSHEVASDFRRDDSSDMVCTALILGVPLAGCYFLRRKAGLSRVGLARAKVE